MKIVRENLYEFQRGMDPQEALKIGGKLKEIEDWLSSFLFKNQWKINKDYTIDIVKGGFVATRAIDRLPNYIQFRKCIGDFIIDNQGLMDMFGCPKIVEGTFAVPDNEISSLNGSPEVVTGNYIIYGNHKIFLKENIEKICQVNGAIIV